MNFIYFDIQTVAINTLRQKIRYAQEKDDPQLLTLWLTEEQRLFDSSDESIGKAAHRRIYQGQFILLLDAIGDTVLPVHWRQLCLDNINRPLINLKRISQCEASQTLLRNMSLELTMIGRHFDH